ncbi:hypothetical protein [Duganella sp. HH101]|uniref:hypothetical protein n=1 Tax=Duganella sp. HH101 TaxID=1781066 RepID=UPI00087358C2|nr:hypothetical protein [Duganella sp. HH101]OEZ98509.1 hypothetical protein DUGA2_55520 [Duganella sp. HH101]
MKMNGSFDTLSYTRRLEAAGIPAEQAEAHALALSDVMRTQCATKADMYDLREAMLAQGGRLDAQGVHMQTMLEVQAAQLQKMLEAQGAQLRQMIMDVAAESEKRVLLLDAKIDREVQRLEGAIKDQGNRLDNAMLKYKNDLMGWTLALNISQIAILFGALAYFRT